MPILDREKKAAAKAVTIRASVYERMWSYLAEKPLAPKAIDLVSIAVTEWLDRQELAKGN